MKTKHPFTLLLAAGMNNKLLKSLIIAGSVLASSITHAIPLLPSFEQSSSYLGIHLGTKDSEAEFFKVSSDGGAAGLDYRSTLGRINPTNDKPASQPGISGPASGSGAQTVPDSHLTSFGGNFALTGSNSQIDFSNTDTYAGSGFGIDCANSNCVKDNSNSNFFTPDGTVPDTTNTPGQTTGLINPGNGVNQGVNLSALVSEITDIRDFISGNGATDARNNITGTLDLSTGIGGSAGYINDHNSGHTNGDFLLSSAVTTLTSGLNIIDIKTGGNDFNINNTNFIIDGKANSTIIFLLDNMEDMLITNSRILAGENMGLNNIMFAVSTNTNDTHFSFSQSEIWGAAFWDFSKKTGENHLFDGSIVMNNVRGCGQWVSNQLGQWNDVSLDRCAFNPTEVPEPSVLALFGIGLPIIAGMRRRKPKCAKNVNNSV